MKEIYYYLKFFYKLRGNALFVMVILMMLAGVFEAFGISVFLPLLEGDVPTTKIGRSMIALFEYCHIGYNLRNILVIMVVFILLRGVFLILKDTYVAKTISNFLVDLRCETIAKLFNVQYLYFLKKDAAYINNAITVEFATLAVSFKLFSTVLLGIIFAVIYFIIPLILNVWLTLLVMAVCIPSFFVMRFLYKKTKTYSLFRTNNNAALQSFLLQILNNFKYIKATNSYHEILKHIKAVTRKLGNVSFKQLMLQSISENSFIPFAVLIIACLMFCQVEILGRSISEVIIVLLFLLRSMKQVYGVQERYRSFLGSYASIKVFDEFNKDLDIHREKNYVENKKPDFAQSLILQNVSFSYVKDKPVLCNLNVEIKPNTTVAFVGASGSGKSTLVTLITGIIRPTAGKIMLGSVDYGDIDQMVLRQKIGYVTQESVIFNDSVRNNITLWDNVAEENCIKKAAEKAHIDKFIDQQPARYNTVLGDNGIKISGGQRQRISIARELYKNVDILIFDEATSSLDSFAEKEIQKNIDEFRGDKTIILVAHRLSTVKNCNHIFVLKDGMIVEEGTYEDLYNKNGEFCRMVNLQKAEVN